MPSYVITLASGSDPATSFITPKNTTKSPKHGSKAREKMQSVVQISESTEIRDLVLSTKDDLIRRFARGVVIPSGRSHVTFNIDQYKDIKAHMMQRYDKDTYSHAFGAVFGPGATVLSGPYSYVIVVVASLNGAVYKVNGQDPKSSNLIHAQQVECGIQVASGQLVAMVFAWRSKTDE